MVADDIKHGMVTIDIMKLVRDPKSAFVNLVEKSFEIKIIDQFGEESDQGSNNKDDLKNQVEAFVNGGENNQGNLITKKTVQ